MRRTTQLTSSISSKLSPSQHAALKARAEAQGVKVSEYARQILLASLNCKLEPNNLIPLLLAETVALRGIVLNVIFALASGETVTAEKMQSLIAHADAEKAAKSQRLLSASQAGGAA